jgi:hypothetical protein
MDKGLLIGVASALIVACSPAFAGSGDVYVPAHRSKDGTLVPANVPPSSGGTHSAARLGKSGAARPASGRSHSGVVAPIFVNAKPLRQA